MSQVVFGRMIHGGQVADAVRDTLKLWLSTYLAEGEEQWGLEKGTIARPRDWVRTTDLEQVPPIGRPLVAIRNVGSLADPDRDGEGVIGMSEAVSVGVYIKGRHVDESLDHAAMMVAAIRSTIEGKPSLGGFADGTWVTDWEYAPLTRRDRTLAAGEVVLRVDVSNVATRGAGPAQPEPEPEPPSVPTWPEYPDPPEAQTVNVTIEPIEEP